MTSPHRWEDQVTGDASRSGCRTCGSERDATGRGLLHRAIDSRAWTPEEPPCRPARNRSGLDGNPENAARALRVNAELVDLSHDVNPGERCPSCGYGTSSPDRKRYAMDVLALEREQPERFARLVAAYEAAHGKPKRRVRA